MAYLAYIASLLVFVPVSAVKIETTASTESSNSNTAPSVKFSGSYDPLKKPKNPYIRVKGESSIGSCERGEAYRVFRVRGKVAS